MTDKEKKVKSLYKTLERRDKKIKQLQRQISDLQAEILSIDKRNLNLEDKIADLQAKLSKMEKGRMSEEEIFEYLGTLNKDIIDIGLSRRHKLAEVLSGRIGMGKEKV